MTSQESKSVPVEVLRKALEQIAAKKCISTSVDYQSDCPCAAHIARRALLSSPSAEAAPGVTSGSQNPGVGFEEWKKLTPFTATEAAPEPDDERRAFLSNLYKLTKPAAPTQEKGSGEGYDSAAEAGRNLNTWGWERKP